MERAGQTAGVTSYIERDTPEFYRTNLAMLSAGFSTFALLYCVQPLLPVFSHEFGVSAAESSLTLSLTTGLPAASVLIAGSLSEAWGRKPLMVVSLIAAAVLTIACAVASWRVLFGGPGAHYPRPLPHRARLAGNSTRRAIAQADSNNRR